MAVPSIDRPADSAQPKRDGEDGHAPFSQVLLELGESDARVVVLAGDLARYVDVLPFAERYPDRFWNMGMAEANIIGMASGLAKSGLRPIVATYGVFITRRAYDQVAMALTTGPTPVVLVGFLPGITCRFSASHQPVDDMALMASLPSMAVHDPADDRELQAAVRRGVKADHPTYIRAQRGNQPPLPLTGTVPLECEPVALGDEDGELGMVSTGLGTRWALEAADLLRRGGHSVSILHMPTVKPFARTALAEFCRRFGRLVTVENHIAHGGLHAAVATTVAQLGLGVRVTPAAIPDRWPPSGTVDYIRGQIGLTAQDIAALALEKHAETGRGE